MTYLFKRVKDITAKPEDWPQGYFKDKLCKYCASTYSPQSPCHQYCSDECAAKGKTSAYLTRKYGITFDDYENMLSDQNHLCKICEGEGFIMAVHHKLKLVVDHCHKTGVVRGLLCHNCNRGLGLLQDDVSSLKKAIDYLEGAETIPKGSTLK